MKLKNILLAGTLAVGLAFNSCQLPFNYLERDGNYSGIVVFTYNETPIKDYEVLERFNEFENYNFENKKTYEPVQKWFDREASKYNQKINICLNLFQEQIKVPKEYIKYNRYPLDLEGLSKYLRKTYKDIKNYDFLTVEYSDDYGWEKEGHNMYAAYANPYSRSIFLRNAFNEGYKYHKKLNKDNHYFAHEFLHLIGASDKYGHEFDGIFDDYDIMRNCSDLFDETIKITESTAKEIGW
jgi:hypothetical protein